MVVYEVGHLPPVEYSLVLGLCHIHERSDVLVVVGANETVEVSHLHHRTYGLVVGDGTLGKVALGIGHIAGLHLHTETACHGHIKAVLDGQTAPGLVVGRCAHVRSHADGGEEVAGTPLHVDALQGIGIVAHPPLVKVGQYAPVDAAATAGAALHHHVGILGAYALEHLLQTLVIGDVEVALVGSRERQRAMRHDRHIGIPLDIGYLRIAGKQIVDHAEDEVLHLGIAHVEHQLVPAASAHERTVLGVDNPVGMTLVEFTPLVGHLGLNPDAKLDVVALGVVEQSLDATRQLTGVGHPVAQSSVVGALILAAKPSVVHHEELAAEGLEVGHHLVHLLLFDIHIHTLPAVEQDVAHLVAMAELVLAAPAVERAAHTALALIAVGERQHWGDKACAPSQMVGRAFLVDASQQIVVVGVVGLHLQSVVAGIAEGCSDGASVVLGGLAVEREHHLGMLCLRVAHTVLVLYGHKSTLQRMLYEPCLVAPCSVEACHPHIAAAYGQHGAGKAVEGDGAFLVVFYLGPCLDDIHVAIGAIADVYHHGVHLVLHAHDGHRGFGLCHHLGVCIAQVGGHRPVGVGNGECGFMHQFRPVGGIDGGARQRYGVVEVLLAETLAKVDIAGLHVFRHFQD